MVRNKPKRGWGGTVKNINTWWLNKMLLNNKWLTEEIKEKIKNTWRQMKAKNMMIQNLCNAAKAVLRGKFIAIQSYLRKQEKSQINNLTLHLKKEEQTKLSRRK